MCRYGPRHMNDSDYRRPAVGAAPREGGGWKFVVWAPDRKKVELHLLDSRTPFHDMERDPLGYHSVNLDSVTAEAKYVFRLDSILDRPDPASRFQPDGVHGPSQTVDLRTFRWSDADWKGIALEDSVFYELHVGTFTPE